MNDDIGFYLFLAIAAAMFLFFQIQKLTRKLDKEEALKPISGSGTANNTNKQNSKNYQGFCDAIDNEIRLLRQDALNNDILKNEENRDKFLEELSNISKKLTFIQTMNANKDAQQWEAQLFEILNRIEVLVDENFKEAQAINDRTRLNLEKRFENL
ncbi:hypothetical protein [Campylobacter californiensis]|uniref:hypothetical protein n=1 Tax=Campylobacter californiensis TaxID=1032243 RepID=UPI00147335B0|nr:hypothetical protein [Campylobacter sp. RM12916]MBE3609172.1 hypothetical protein [Campylobacter sp. RM12916]